MESLKSRYLLRLFPFLLLKFHDILQGGKKTADSEARVKLAQALVKDGYELTVVKRKHSSTKNMVNSRERD